MGGLYLAGGGGGGSVGGRVSVRETSLPRCAQTDTCEIITVPQTSFVGGNYTNEGYLRLPTLARISIL